MLYEVITRNSGEEPPVSDIEAVAQQRRVEAVKQGGQQFGPPFEDILQRHLAAGQGGTFQQRWPEKSALREPEVIRPTVFPGIVAGMKDDQVV